MYSIVKGIWPDVHSFLDAVEAGVLFLHKKLSATRAESLPLPRDGPLDGPLALLAKALLLKTLEVQLKLVRFARDVGIPKVSAAVAMVQWSNANRWKALFRKLQGIASNFGRAVSLLDPVELTKAGGCLVMHKFFSKGPLLHDPVLWAQLIFAGLTEGCKDGGAAAVSVILRSVGFPVLMFSLTRRLCSDQFDWPFKQSDIISEEEENEIKASVADLMLATNAAVEEKVGARHELDPSETMDWQMKLAYGALNVGVDADNSAREFNARQPRAGLADAEEAVAHAGEMFLSWLNSRG